MKLFRLLFFIILLPSAPAVFAQTETFDIARYSPPKNWARQSDKNHLAFKTENKSTGSFSLISLYPSRQGSDNLKDSFQAEWNAKVSQTFKTQAKASNFTELKHKDWDVLAGNSLIELNGAKIAAFLTVFQGHGRVFSVLYVFNSTEYRERFKEFMDSLDLNVSGINPVPPASSEPSLDHLPSAENENSGGTLIGAWNSGTSGGFQEIGPGGYRGVTRGGDTVTYVFKADQTYVYQALFDGVMGGLTIFIYETGRYELEGNNLKLSPQKQLYRRNGVDSWSEKIEGRNYSISFIEEANIQHLMLNGGETRLKFTRDR